MAALTKHQLTALEGGRAERLRQLGIQIRDARMDAGMTQADLGEALAPSLLGEVVPQTTVSRWEKGAVGLDVETLRAVELALSLPQGALFTPIYAPTTLEPKRGESWLRSDPNIHPSLRDTAVSQYRAWLKLSKDVTTGQTRRRVH